MKIKKIAALGLAALMAMSIVACGGNPDSTTPDNEPASTAPEGSAEGSASSSGGETGSYGKSDETLTVMLASEPQGLTSLNGIQDQAMCVVSNATGAHLWRMNTDTYEIEPELVDECETIDETHYRISIKPEAVFSDGTKVTAEDVLFSLGAYNAASQEYAKHINIDESVVEDDETFILAYDQYVPGWDAALSETGACIYSKEYIEANGGVEAFDRQAPLSAGRYNVAEWKEGEYMMLERNESYWDEDYEGYYKNIKIMWASDSASRLLAVKSGDADVAVTISVSEGQTLQNDPTAKAVFFDLPTIFNFYFNNSKEGPFADPAVREAAMYAIDTQAINALVNMGMGRATQGYVPTVNPYYKEYYEGGISPYDEAKAKELLAEAGYPDGFSCECIVLQANMNIATIIQEGFRKIGIEMNVTPMEPSSYVGEAKSGNYDVTIGNFNCAYVSADNFDLVDPAMNDTIIGGTKIDDPAMSEIIAKAKSFDAATAEEGWSEAIDYLFDNTCLVGLCNKVDCVVVNPEIEGLTLTKREYVDITTLHPAG